MMSDFTVFKQLPIGGLAREVLHKRLLDAGVRFNEYATTLFEHPSFAPGRQIEQMTLVKVTFSDLSLTAPCSVQDLARRAATLDLGFCPLYLAAFLRLDYLEQPEGPYLTIVSPPPASDEAYPTGFYLRKLDNVLWLRGYRAVGDAEWPPDNEFVFCKITTKGTS